VTTLAGVSMLPLADVSATVVPEMPLLPESAREMLNVPGPLPRIRLEGPVRVNDVPTTATVTVTGVDPTVAVTVIVRLVWSAGVVSVAVADPFTSVTADAGVMAPELAEKETVAPGTS
jgi:hypothetical protein